MVLIWMIKGVFYHNFSFYKFFLLYIKMSECNSIENTDLRTKNKEKIRIKARDKYRNLSEEEKK